MSRARDFADLASAYSGGALSKRNIVDNGNFAVHQRGGTITGLGDANLDRWKTVDSGNIDELAIEITQSNDTPDGVGEGYSLKYQTKTVESAIAADEFFSLNQHIEAQNLARLCYGTSSAKSITLSFWVKCSLTGTFGFNIYQEDGGDVIGGTYAISSADTWEKKILTFAGNTGDAIAYDNTNGFRLQWALWIGSNYTGTSNTSWSAYSNVKRFNGHTQNGLATTDESTWQIAFVQLELGEVATPFEHESYADNLRRCQRYFHKIITTATYTRFMVGQATAATTGEHYYEHPVEMRAEPSIGQTGTASNYAVYHNNAVIACSSVPAINTDQTTKMGVLTTVVASGQTQGEVTCLVGNNNASAYIEFNAEL
jgi:hypothetical protein